MILKRTYEKILGGMQTAYFDECAGNADDDSQAMRLLEIMASELYSLSCYGDYIFRQAFVQTATGDCLDMLGELRDCPRKKASYAFGTLTFTVPDAAEENIIIPMGTVCSAVGKPYIQYATDEDGVIPAGELSARVSARAISPGGRI